MIKFWRYRKCLNCNNLTLHRGGRNKDIPCCSADCWQDIGG